MSKAGRNMRTHARDTSFAAPTERRLNCAVRTPKKMVIRTDTEAWRAPTNGTTRSDVSRPMVDQEKERIAMNSREWYSARYVTGTPARTFRSYEESVSRRQVHGVARPSR